MKMHDEGNSQKRVTESLLTCHFEKKETRLKSK